MVYGDTVRSDGLNQYALGTGGPRAFADHRIVEYLWNVPWEMKSHGDRQGAAASCCCGLVPEEVLWRKKSPYPKTYDPAYEKLLGEKLKEVISEPQARCAAFLIHRRFGSFLTAHRIMESLGMGS